ncbi:MAG: zinc ribbon domain-containing protein [Clostridia bacterium]|nr:zinc ribbon domain-containing protein [Clostridia bacterium]
MRVVSPLTKVVIIIAVLAFLLPFVTVSFLGVTESQSGFEIVKEELEGMKRAKEFEDLMKGFVRTHLFILVLAVIAFIFTFLDSRKVPPIIGAVLCVTEAVLLIVAASKTFGYIDYAGIGWFISLFGFILAAAGQIFAACYNISYSVRNRNYVRQQEFMHANRPVMAMTCPWCQTTIPNTIRFCHTCGREVKRDCPYCGAENYIAAKTCTTCGKEFPYGGMTPQESQQQPYTPAPQQQYAPAPQQQYAPAPQQQYAPAPQQQYAPNPQQQYAPAGQRQYVPNPQQQYAPNPQQQYAPAGQRQYAPNPQQQYAPAPQQPSAPASQEQSAPASQQPAEPAPQQQAEKPQQPPAQQD